MRRSKIFLRTKSCSCKITSENRIIKTTSYQVFVCCPHVEIFDEELTATWTVRP